MTTKINECETLRKLVALTGIAGEWRCRANHHQYRAEDGGVLHWWKSTSTIRFQGPEMEATAFRAAF